MKSFIQDCKHMLWLFRQMVVLGLQGDWEGSYEAWFWIRFHWKYESKKIK